MVVAAIRQLPNRRFLCTPMVRMTRFAGLTLEDIDHLSQVVMALSIFVIGWTGWETRQDRLRKEREAERKEQDG